VKKKTRIILIIVGTIVILLIGIGISVWVSMAAGTKAAASQGTHPLAA